MAGLASAALMCVCLCLAVPAGAPAGAPAPGAGAFRVRRGLRSLAELIFHKFPTCAAPVTNFRFFEKSSTVQPIGVKCDRFLATYLLSQTEQLSNCAGLKVVRPEVLVSTRVRTRPG